MTNGRIVMPSRSEEAMRARGLGWSFDGPKLRNHTPRAPSHDRFFEPIEVIIWIATRDTQAIAGANGLMVAGLDRDLPPNRGAFAQIIIKVDLPGDVAGHHVECARFVPDLEDDEGRSFAQPPGLCDCAERGRLRYCRCPDRLETDRVSCTCTREAITTFFDAVHAGMPIFGRRSGEDEFVAVPEAALAGMAMQYDERGLVLLPSFEVLRIPREEVVRRWPADFSDMPTEVPSMVRRPPGPIVASRPIKHDGYLTLFCERLRMGQTKPTKPREVQAIRTALKSSTHDPKTDTIDKAIRPFWGQIAWGDDEKPSNAAHVIANVRASLGLK
jgi:hypothetical protein